MKMMESGIIIYNQSPVEMLPTFRLMGKSTPALTRAFRATACRSGVIGSTADAKVTKDLGTAYPIGIC